MVFIQARERVRGQVRGFFDFIREQGVVGLAIGFVLGGSVTRVVQAFANDLVNPFIGLLFNSTELKQASTTIAAVTFKWGNFLTTVIDFIIIAAVVYIGFKLLRLDRVDRKKEG